MVVGSIQIDVKVVSRVGVRINTNITVTHTISQNENTVYPFPLTITSNLLHDWDIEDGRLEDGIKPLIAEMYDGNIGLRLTAPKYGYWFDQYNSEATIHDTVNKMRNEGRKWFLQNPGEEDRISAIFGGGILSELEEVDKRIVQKISMHLLDEPDRAFERSEAVYDLSTPPANDQDFINKAMENWLIDTYGQGEAERLTKPFRNVRGLRNQYPLHDRYKGTNKDNVVERDRVKTAAEFFGFLEHDDNSAKWKKVCESFKQAIQELDRAILI